MNVSVLVPFRDEKDTNRLANWQWLEQRWRAALPDAEIVVGTDEGMPFSKTVAVNDAYSRATGDVFIIADADSWVPFPLIRKAINYSIHNGVLVVPWSTAHRLSRKDSDAIRASDPATPDPIITPAIRERADDYRPSPSTAAMVIVVTREGFELVGGMDPRFRGWGQEDVAFGLSCGTLLGQTKLMLGEAWALFHVRSRKDGLRIWENDSGHHNVPLGDRYWAAKGNVRAMAAICREHPLDGAATEVGPSPSRGKHPEVLVREFAVGGTRVGETVVL